jgi:LacI family transcriptional regulator
MDKSRKIVLLLETERAFDRQILRGIGQYSRLHGSWAFHIESERLNRLKPPASLWDADGIIARLSSKRIADAIHAARVPSVVIDCNSTPPGLRSKQETAIVCPDSEGTARLAAEHFSLRGFKQLALVGVPNRDWSDIGSNGHNQAIGYIGPPFIVDPAGIGRNHRQARRRDELAKWLKGLPKPIGVVACDDERAFQVLEACRSARIAVPNEVAILGVGNDELLCALANPPLSSVALNVVQGGYLAAQVLDRLVQHLIQSPQQLTIQPYSVISRASTDIDVSYDPIVNAARNIISRRCSQDLPVAALAKSVGISVRTLQYKFRKCIGRTVLQAIQEIRLSRAKLILKETELPIARVACLSGYRSVSYFVRVFSEEISMPPLKYRMASRVSETRQGNWPGTWRLAE